MPAAPAGTDRMAGVAELEPMKSYHRMLATGFWALAALCVAGCAARPVSMPPARSVPRRERTDTARLETPVRRSGGPLWRAEELLDEALSEGEWRLVQGLPVRSSRLTHLRLTRGALDALGTGERARALDLLERAIAADGSTGFAYLFLGKLYLDDGHVEQGRLLIEQAVELLPDDRVLARQIRRLRSAAEEPGALSRPRIGG